jgi:hypothetical protein
MLISVAKSQQDVHTAFNTPYQRQHLKDTRFTDLEASFAVDLTALFALTSVGLYSYGLHTYTLVTVEKLYIAAEDEEMSSGTQGCAACLPLYRHSPATIREAIS